MVGGDILIWRVTAETVADGSFLVGNEIIVFLFCRFVLRLNNSYICQNNKYDKKRKCKGIDRSVT